MIPADLLRDIALVCQIDAGALRGDYSWPPKVATDEERREAQRLETLAARIWYRIGAEAPPLPEGPHDLPDCPCGHPPGEQGPCAVCNCADDLECAGAA